MFQGKFTLTGVSGISLAENCVTIAGYNLTRLEQTPDIFFELVIRSIQTNVFDNLSEKKIT